MTKSIPFLMLVGLVISLSGCIIIDVDEKSSPGSYPKDDTVVEIDAVGKLSFENDRLQAYKSIAGREGLNANAQIHLVGAVYKKLDFEESKVDVLMALINNPSFCSAGKRAILDGLDNLSFENTKQKILKAVSERGV